MINNYSYNDLDGHFGTPKKLSPFYNYKRLPRKLKKNLKKNYSNVMNDDLLDLNQKMWYILYLKNPDYHRFLIKKIVNEQ